MAALIARPKVPHAALVDMFRRLSSNDQGIASRARNPSHWAVSATRPSPLSELRYLQGPLVKPESNELTRLTWGRTGHLTRRGSELSSLPQLLRGIMAGDAAPYGAHQGVMRKVARGSAGDRSRETARVGRARRHYQRTGQRGTHEDRFHVVELRSALSQSADLRLRSIDPPLSRGSGR
jgi:hypothetical protein